MIQKSAILPMALFINCLLLFSKTCPTEFIRIWAVSITELLKNMMKDKEKVGKSIFTCDICHRKTFRFWKWKGSKNIFLHVIFPMENLLVFKTLFCNNQACYHPDISSWIYWGRQILVFLWIRVSYITLIFPFQFMLSYSKSNLISLCSFLNMAYPGDRYHCAKYRNLPNFLVWNFCT